MWDKDTKDLRKRLPRTHLIENTVWLLHILRHVADWRRQSGDLPQLYERQRRIILAAGTIAAQGRIQREGKVVRPAQPTQKGPR
jgi:hypothetical protein